LPRRVVRREELAATAEGGASSGGHGLGLGFHERVVDRVHAKDGVEDAGEGVVLFEGLRCWWDLGGRADGEGGSRWRVWEE